MKVDWLAPGIGNVVAEVSKRCVHLGAPVGTTITCETCKGHVELKVFSCRRFSQCTLAKHVEGYACCNGSPDAQGVTRPCEGYQTERTVLEPVVVMGGQRVPQEIVPKTWAYGVTTVPERADTTLLTTLASLREAGFSNPRLFVDSGLSSSRSMYEALWATAHLDITHRSPRVYTFGNWVLGLWELYVRQPDAERYAMFQDDMVAVKNLRAYLDACEWPGKAYLNLYQYGGESESIAPERREIGRTGRRRGAWYESKELPHPESPTYHGRRPQGGKGAVALVFDRAAVVALLSHPHMVVRPQDTRPDKNKSPGWTLGAQKVDGGIVESMNQAGFREYVHSPSLVQHVGEVSSMGSYRHPQAPSFPGEKFDALDLLP